MKKLALHGGEPVCKKQFPTNMLGASLIDDEELNELKDVIREKSPFRHYGIGHPTKVTDFEKLAREYFGCKYALAVSSGSSALLCAIAALGIGPGDEVIIPAFAWYSDYCALVNFGVMPVFADIGEDLNLDPADFERKITQKTKAVIPIHYQGCPANMDEIMRIARANNLVVIEDCAQAVGGDYRNVKLGTIGDIAIASFQVHKLVSCGEGGLVFTNNEKYFARAVRYHDLGFVRTVFEEQLEDKSLAAPENSFAGLQFRMSELQGAFMIAQFRKLDTILERCRSVHKKIREHFIGNPHFSIRYRDGDCGIALVLLMKTKEEAELFAKCVNAEGIPCGPTSACCNLVSNYPIKNKALVNKDLPPFGKGYDGENVEFDINVCCPKTNDIVDRFVAIGIGPLYGEDEIEYIIKAIEKVSSHLF